MPRLSRDQLAKFLPDERSVREFEKLFGTDTDLATLVLNIIAGAGLNSDGGYEVPTGSNFLDATTSLYNAIRTLDDVGYTELVTTVNTHTVLNPESVSLLVDASGGAINITLPNPALTFVSGRSFRIGITKIDSSSNAVNILPYAAETVAGSASEFLDVQGEVLNFITNGTNWYLLN